MQGPLAPLFGAGRFWPKLQKAPARAPAHQLVLLISIHVPYGVLSSKKIQIDLWLFYVNSYASDKIFGEP